MLFSQTIDSQCHSHSQKSYKFKGEIEGKNGLKGSHIFVWYMCVSIIKSKKPNGWMKKRLYDKAQYCKLHTLVWSYYLFMCVHSNHHQGTHKCGLLVNHINGARLIQWIRKIRPCFQSFTDFWKTQLTGERVSKYISSWSFM